MRVDKEKKGMKKKKIKKIVKVRNVLQKSKKLNKMAQFEMFLKKKGPVRLFFPVLYL